MSHTTYKINEVHSKGCREDPAKVTKITKFTKVMKTAKFMIIHHTTYKVNEIYSKGSREGPSKVTKVTKFTKTGKLTIIRHTTYKMQRNSFIKLQGRPIESYENYENYARRLKGYSSNKKRFISCYVNRDFSRGNMLAQVAHK